MSHVDKLLEMESRSILLVVSFSFSAISWNVLEVLSLEANYYGQSGAMTLTHLLVPSILTSPASDKSWVRTPSAPSISIPSRESGTSSWDRVFVVRVFEHSSPHRQICDKLC